MKGISPKELVSGIIIETHLVPQPSHYLQKYIFICCTVFFYSFNFSWEEPAGGSGLRRKLRMLAMNFSELMKPVFSAAKIREEMAAPDSRHGVHWGNPCGGFPHRGQLSPGHPAPGTGGPGAPADAV